MSWEGLYYTAVAVHAYKHWVQAVTNNKAPSTGTVVYGTYVGEVMSNDFKWKDKLVAGAQSISDESKRLPFKGAEQQLVNTNQHIAGTTSWNRPAL